MCKDIIDSGTKFLHFYTVNLEKSTAEVVGKLGIQRKKNISLPWTKPNTEDRKEESVRPIFWSQKPKSYIARTNEWDEYPNGRWGVSRSPAFGDVSEYPSMAKIYKKNKKRKLKLWGAEYTSHRQIGELVMDYIEGKVKHLPWCEERIEDETSIIGEFIRTLNKNYLFTINSQPRANSMPSSDPIFGWGPKGGYVYQKQYVEFLIPKQFVDTLVNVLDEHPSISYQGINSEGNPISNVSSDSVNAVTWGIFPNKEVVQPTVVDHTAFYMWSEELFGQIREDWLPIYGPESKSYEIIKSLHDDYYLFNLVDNDFINGTLEKIMLDYIDENLEAMEAFESVGEQKQDISAD